MTDNIALRLRAAAARIEELAPTAFGGDPQAFLAIGIEIMKIRDLAFETGRLEERGDNR